MTAQIDVQQILETLCEDLARHLKEREITRPLVIGIRTGGVWLADSISKHLSLAEPYGELDISFYRDDFQRIGLNPKVKPSKLPVDTEGRDVILVDDVIMSGRTIRAAMNEIFDYGRPDSITLVALIDLGARELPIQPDLVGRTLQLASHQRVKLVGPDPLRVEVREKAPQ
ncbi:bifunctional pyr operon transcriptional regulator/uracil phosphoribosyltransferase PyrR [Marinobacteraceae bacterium S3BR75-40.1]